VWWYDYLPGYRVSHVRESAAEAYDVVEKLEFVRDIPLSD
jgi:hypothetical protein